MANLNYIDEIKENSSRLTSKEQMLGKGLNQPFNATNSGVRKIMSGVHSDHAFVLMHGELPIVATGYENRFGDHSSSIIEIDSDSTVIAKIPKFSFAPNHHYYLILQDNHSNRLSVIERISYKYITEVYGYLNNSTELDKLQPGYGVPNGTVLKRSIGFDEFGNKVDGINLNCAYIATDNNMEDSVIISDVCAAKLTAPLIKSVKVQINENDIPLNLYGDDNIYKVCPDIGEEVKNGILLAYRREKKEESIYTQAYERLKHIMMSDEKITVNGRVIDINIYCNNPSNLADNIYNSQFKLYYEENLRMANEIVRIVSPYTVNGFELDYSLQKLFATSKRVLRGDQYIDKKQFSNLIIEYIVLEERTAGVGDKLADRCGGKGVISCIRPQRLMPKLPNGQYVDCIKNQSTMYNRENPGQIFEVSLNYIAMNILDYIATGVLDPRESMDMIIKFISFIAPDQANELRNCTINMEESELKFFVESIYQDGCIYISAKPMSDAMDIDTLAKIYKEFPWIKQQNLIVPITDSNGNVRYVETRRPMIAGKQYIRRLKQFAEEKFSATSLSATNIVNQNSRSKASKNYRELYPNTPIKFGPMESGDMAHLGDVVVINLLLHSLSPHGRRLAEAMHTEDPYDVDIKLDSKSKNRSVEILNTRLKTMGYRLVFRKVKKKRAQAFKINAIEFENNPKGVEAIQFIEDPNFDFMKDYEIMREKEENRKKRAISIVPMTFEIPEDEQYKPPVEEDNK